MEKKESLVEMRSELLSRTTELDLSLDTELKIGRIIQNTAPEQDHKAREVKAAELLDLLKDCKNEEDVLKKLQATSSTPSPKTT